MINRRDINVTCHWPEIDIIVDIKHIRADGVVAGRDDFDLSVEDAFVLASKLTAAAEEGLRRRSYCEQELGDSDG